MEKKLAVIVDNKEITTEISNIEMCSSACDVAMETCSSQSHDALRKRRVISKIASTIPLNKPFLLIAMSVTMIL